MQNLWIHCILYEQSRLRSALVAKLVDAQDLKSCGLQTPCRFDSGPGHHLWIALVAQLDRVLVYGTRGYGFNSCLARQLYKREVAQLGSAPGLGPGGRRFKSCLPDHLFGALAQLGERLLCTQEVRSSILLGSTNLINHIHGGIAQLARAFGSYPECRGFKSLSRYHLIKKVLW